MLYHEAGTYKDKNSCHYLKLRFSGAKKTGGLLCYQLKKNRPSGDPQKSYGLFWCPKVGSFPGCIHVSLFLKASKCPPQPNQFQCASTVCSLWQVHLQTQHSLSFLAFILKIALLTRAGFVSLPDMTNNKLMRRREQDQKVQNNPTLYELHK